jgi:hypothetical protein
MSGATASVNNELRISDHAARMRQRELDLNFVTGFCREAGGNVVPDLLLGFVSWAWPLQNHDAVERSGSNVLA